MYHTLGTLQSPSPPSSLHSLRRNVFQTHLDPWTDTTLYYGSLQLPPQHTMLVFPPLLESRDGVLHNTAAGRRQTSGSMPSSSRTAPSTGTSQASPETKVRVIMKDGNGYLVFVFIIAEQSNLLWLLMIKGYSIVKPMGVLCRVFLKNNV